VGKGLLTAAWTESLSGRRSRACCEESARQTGAIRSFADPFSLATLTDQEMAAIHITRADFHGEWNYTIRPSNPSDTAVDP
jgi:hypothetical protein